MFVRFFIRLRYATALPCHHSTPIRLTKLELVHSLNNNKYLRIVNSLFHLKIEV
jgi:hypothetical protein